MVVAVMIDCKLEVFIKSENPASSVSMITPYVAQASPQLHQVLRIKAALFLSDDNES